jgi:DNA-binding transcriptional MerR regulator
MLVAGYDVQHVADELGVQRQAVHRWSEKHTFKSQLNDAVFRVYDAAIAELINSAEYASKELIRIIKDDKTPPRVKVSAINSLLNFATKAKEHYIQESSNNYIDIEVDSYE